MIASYPMYCLPQMQASVTRWWLTIAEHLNSLNFHVPLELLSVETDLIEHWLRPDLLFSQTCGYPLVSILKKQVKLIGTINYSSDYCDGPNYCSLLLVNKENSSNSIESFENKSFAYNEHGSQSGFNAVRIYLNKHSLSIPFFRKNIHAGQHINSLTEVANNTAKICAIDCVTYSLLERHQPEKLENVRILGKTMHTPGLPLITSVETPGELVNQLYMHIEDMCQDQSLAKINHDLMIKGISKVPYSTYTAQIILPKQAVEKL